MTDVSLDSILKLLDTCLNERQPKLDSMHHEALRLFNGFLEGCPELLVDVYASTLLLYDYAEKPDSLEEVLPAVRHFYRQRLPWIHCMITKTRISKHVSKRQGESDGGGQPVHRIMEHNTWYAIDLTMNQDASFYLDTRNLRQWLRENAQGWHILNTFAYTGSLGIAALAGGASHVIQTDRSRKFLELAEESYEVNGYATSAHEHIIGDFFPIIGRMRHGRTLFDCVIVDPPFFSATDRGTVDLLSQSQRILNKVRPLIRDGGYLVAINNALYLSGSEYHAALEAMCADGYLSIESLIPVPEDVTGFPDTIHDNPPANPAPFNHSTKIAVLRVKKK